jgi:LPS-assembly lipoprotein
MALIFTAISSRVVLGSALAVALALGGCGFRLQGRQVLPEALSTVAIEATDEQSEFTHALREAITSSGGKVVPSIGTGPSDAATVVVSRDNVSERVLSVSSRNIPTDYELTYTVELAVTRGGTELLGRETFTLSRVYSFDETRLLAKEREKDILVEALARDMASVVARRLSAL